MKWILLIIGFLFIIAAFVLNGIEKNKRDMLFDKFDSLQREWNETDDSETRKKIRERQIEILAEIKDI